MPPCSCAFLSMRRRTESHPCVPQRGRHDHEPVQIHLSAAVGGQPVTSGLCSFIVAPTPRAGPRPTAGRGRSRKAPEVSRWTPFWFFFPRELGGPFKTPSFSRRHKCPRRRDSTLSACISCLRCATTQEKHRPRTGNLAALRLGECLFCSDAFAFSTLCPFFPFFFFFNVKAFLRAAISRSTRKAAHLHPLNASQQRGPPF